MSDTDTACLEHAFSTPTLVLHCGPGLGQADASPDAMLLALRERTEGALAAACLPPPASGSRSMLVPEMLRDISVASMQVLRAYHETRKFIGARLSVATLSEALFNAVLNAVCDAGLASQVLVILHHKDGTSREHRLDKEGFLTDWPYGILMPELDETELMAMGLGRID